MYNGNTSGNKNIRFHVQDQSGGLDADNYKLDLSTPADAITHTNGSNGFHHIAITNSGGANAYQTSSLGIKIYINGVEQTLTDNSNGGGLPDAGVSSNTFAVTPNNIALGRQPTNANYMRDSKSLMNSHSLMQNSMQLKLLVCITVVFHQTLISSFQHQHTGIEWVMVIQEQLLQTMLVMQICL